MDSPHMIHRHELSKLFEKKYLQVSTSALLKIQFKSASVSYFVENISYAHLWRSSFSVNVKLYLRIDYYKTKTGKVEKLEVMWKMSTFIWDAGSSEYIL